MSKYRDSMNRRFTRALFHEFNREEENSAVLYTLKDVDSHGYPSLRRLYLEEEDLTEYTFANKYFESWEHWQIICSCTWFQVYRDQWRTELEMLLQSRALRAILDESLTGGKNAYDANKYIVAKGWIKSEGGRRGRPSKADITKAAAEQAFADYKVSEDAKRLGIN